ncbi:MAG: class I SAM-dependent methyltransferase [Myxococcota bacterium]
MACHVCPWWLGYLLLSPLRRLGQDPHVLLSPHVRADMTVLEVGPGMGYFSLELGRLVGPQGRVTCTELQPRMLRGLRRRLERAGLAARFDLRHVGADSLAVQDLADRVDFALLFAVVHEVADQRRLFAEVFAALRRGGALLVAEPSGHVSAKAFAASEALATEAGFEVASRPLIRRSRAVLLVKTDCRRASASHSH